MSIYTKETLGPLSYHYAHNDIDRIQKQLARERELARVTERIKSDFDYEPLYLFDGKNWSVNK